MKVKVCAVAVVSAMACALLVEGVPLYVTRIPNGKNVPGVEALGHEDSIGEESIRNVFGIAFEEVGTEWTKELCEADSDEDGQTNGQELGDPCCIWTEGGKPQWTSGVSHPGDDSKTSDESRWTNLDCEAVKDKAEADAEDKADKEASKNSPDESEDSEVDISMGDDSAASTTIPEVANALMCIVIPAMMQMAWW